MDIATSSFERPASSAVKMKCSSVSLMSTAGSQLSSPRASLREARKPCVEEAANERISEERGGEKRAAGQGCLGHVWYLHV
jgi:hypothetical protein